MALVTKTGMLGTMKIHPSKFAYIVILLLAPLILLQGCFNNNATLTEPASFIMSYEEVAMVKRKVPYVRLYRKGNNMLCLVGVEHTSDVHSQTIQTIFSEWSSFSPTVAFFEGTGWAKGKNQEVVGAYGEPAYLRYLAFVDRVPIASIEPDLVDEIQYLQLKWSDVQIRSFYTLRWISQRSSVVEGPALDEEVTRFLQSWFPRLDSFSREPSSSADLSIALKALLPANFDWRNSKPEWVDPAFQLTYLNEIARASGQFRDHYMLNTLIEEAVGGEKVFIAVGFKHAHMLEPALSEVFGKPIIRADAQQCILVDSSVAEKNIGSIESESLEELYSGYNKG